MGHVDRDRSLAAAAQPGAIVDALRVVCEENGHCWLQDGTAVRFRLVEPADVPACHEMLSACSRKSLYSRYERAVTGPLAELAEGLCSPDLSEELTVVAETCVDGSNVLIGIAQLLAGPPREAAEYAVLVADPWQSKGLGGAFTDCCLRLAHAWGIRRVVAEFLPGNMRIIRILEKRSFDIYRDMQEHAVSGQKHIDERDGVRVPGGGPTDGNAIV